MTNKQLFKKIESLIEKGNAKEMADFAKKYPAGLVAYIEMITLRTQRDLAAVNMLSSVMGYTISGK